MMCFALSAIAAGAVMTACSSNDHAAMPGMSGSATAPAPAPAPVAQNNHNQADVTFAQQMIPHHQQAVDMAKLVPSHTSNQQVVALAAQIQQAQNPEIQQMTGWLQHWGVSGTMPGMGMPGMSSTMPGVMSSAEMAQLGNAKDAAFDRMWLQMMVQHHQGAIDMAKTELQQGGNAEAKQLAQKIIDGQQAEITTMNGLLSQM
jgi:uncharacterized protein (DUF305 family)